MLRATIHFRLKNDKAKAYADLDELLSNRPDSLYYYLWRGNFHIYEDDPEGAIPEFAKLAELAPKSTEAHYWLAVSRFATGDFAGAADGLHRLMALADSGYAVILHHIAATRAGRSAKDELDANARRFKGRGWPMPIADLYLDRSSPDTVLAAATTSAERCEAEFFIAQWHLLKGRAAEAKGLIESVLDSRDCGNPTSAYSLLAKRELRRLKDVSPKREAAPKSPPRDDAREKEKTLRFEVCNRANDGDALFAAGMTSKVGNRWQPYKITGWWRIRPGACDTLMTRKVAGVSEFQVAFYAETDRFKWKPVKGGPIQRGCFTRRKFEYEASVQGDAFDCSDYDDLIEYRAFRFKPTADGVATYILKRP